MPDIVAITGALSAIKTATEVAKTLREIDKSVQTADLKLKIADLTDALANAKLALVEVQETLSEKDKETSDFPWRYESSLKLFAIRMRTTIRTPKVNLLGILTALTVLS